MNEKAGGATNRSDPAGRLKLLESNVSIYSQILPEIFRTAPEAVILVVTDPPDPLADFVRTSGFTRVLSTGTFLDSLRFRFHVARHLQVDPASVEANVLGEHGTSEVFMWSSAQVASVRVLEALQQTDRGRQELRRSIEEEVRYANITIIEGNQASQFGIGMVAARIAEIVLRDERAVIPIGSYNPTYGVTLSMPSVLGRTGVVQILEPAMSAEERQALERSAETLKAAVAGIHGGVTRARRAPTCGNTQERRRRSASHGKDRVSRAGADGRTDGQAPAPGRPRADGMEPHAGSRRAAGGRRRCRGGIAGGGGRGG
jgi:L-lactate dehydrogenase